MVEEFKMKKALMQVLMYVCLMLPLGACSSDTPQEPEGGTTAPEYFSGVWITSYQEPLPTEPQYS